MTYELEREYILENFLFKLVVCILNSFSFLVFRLCKALFKLSLKFSNETIKTQIFTAEYNERKITRLPWTICHFAVMLNRIMQCACDVFFFVLTE